MCVPRFACSNSLVVGIGRRHGDDFRIGRGIERARVRTGIAGGRDQHDAIAAQRREHALQLAVRRAREAHVDDVGLGRAGPVETLEDVHARALRALRANACTARIGHRRRRAGELAVRRDHAGDAGAVGMRLVGRAGRVERRRDRAGEIGMLRVDRRVDHRDAHACAARERVRLGKPQLAERVLRRTGCGRRALLERVEEVRLRAENARVGLQRADHARRPRGRH